MVDTPKNDFWQVVVLTPTGVSAGTYVTPTVTVDTDGRISAISSPSTTTTTSYVADVPSLSGLVATAAAGKLVVVVDGGNTRRALYVFDGSAFQRLTNDGKLSLRYMQATINTTPSQNLDAALPTDAIIVRVSLKITSVFDSGTSIEIKGAAGQTYMSSSENDPLTQNTYVVELSSATAVGSANAQIQALVSGSPSAGAGLVNVTYLLPN